MPDSDDHLAVIAESYRLHAEAVQQIHVTQRLALRIHVFALTLLGVALLTAALLGWTVLTNTQTIAAQTQVLLTTIARPMAPAP